METSLMSPMRRRGLRRRRRRSIELLRFAAAVLICPLHVALLIRPLLVLGVFFALCHANERASNLASLLLPQHTSTLGNCQYTRNKKKKAEHGAAQRKRKKKLSKQN